MIAIARSAWGVSTGSPARAPSSSARIVFSSSSRTSDGDTPIDSTTRTPRFSPSSSMPSRTCSVPTKPWARLRAAANARSSAWASRGVPRPGSATPRGSPGAAVRAPSRSAVEARSASSSARWHTAETGMPASRTASARASGRYTLIFGTGNRLFLVGLYRGYSTPRAACSADARLRGQGGGGARGGLVGGGRAVGPDRGGAPRRPVPVAHRAAVAGPRDGFRRRGADQRGDDRPGRSLVRGGRPRRDRCRAARGIARLLRAHGVARSACRARGPGGAGRGSRRHRPRRHARGRRRARGAQPHRGHGARRHPGVDRDRPHPPRRRKRLGRAGGRGLPVEPPGGNRCRGGVARGWHGAVAGAAPIRRDRRSRCGGRCRRLRRTGRDRRRRDRSDPIGRRRCDDRGRRERDGADRRAGRAAARGTRRRRRVRGRGVPRHLERMTADEASVEIARWEALGEYRTLLGSRIFTMSFPPLDRDTVEPLVVLHGFPTSSYDFHAVVDELRRDRAVHLVDFLGYGLSDKPDRAYPISMQADLVAAFLGEIDLTRFALLTHDMDDTIGGELLARVMEGTWVADVTRRVVTNGSIYIEMAHLSAGQQLLLALPDERLDADGFVDAASVGAGVAATFSAQSHV